MADRSVDVEDSLEDFDPREVTFDGETVRVHVAGTGPAVIVISELPGITPHVARFARWVRAAGFTVWMPSLFGRDGAPATMELAGEALQSRCVRREFTAFANGDPSPAVLWLRRLAAQAHAECGGPGVGAIGMCFTGNFALGMMLEASVLAPVLSQPSLPFDDPAGTYFSEAEMAAVKQRMDVEDLTVLAYRFDGDPYCKAERFASFQRALGDRFVPRVLPDSSAGPGGLGGVPHSVVTNCLIDEAGQPTAEARDEIIGFFVRRLHARPA